jgi:hypothetical protein
MHPRSCRTGFTPCRTWDPEDVPSYVNSSSRPTSRGAQASEYRISSPTDTKSTFGDFGKNRMPSDKSRFSIDCLPIPGFNSREYFHCAYLKLTSLYAHQPNIDNTNASPATTKRLSRRFTFSILARPAVRRAASHFCDTRSGAWCARSRQRFILSTPERRIRRRRDATGAPISGRNEGRRAAALCAHSGGKR